MQHEFLAQYKRKPVPMMNTFKEHGVTTDMIANYIGTSYPYANSVLNGTYRMSKPVEQKLRKLAVRLDNGVNVRLRKSKPTKYKAIFKRHNVSATTLANYLNRSYPHVCGCLNGYIKMPDKMKGKLDDLVSMLEGGNG
jgi:hypothetical protein